MDVTTARAPSPSAPEPPPAPPPSRTAAADPSGLGARLAWLTALRLGLFVILLGLVGFLYFRGSAPEQSLTFLLRTLGLGFAAAVVYGELLRRRRALVSVAYVQVAVDQLTWSALAYVSGGIASGATSFYGLSCVAGAVLLGVRGAVFGAAAGALCLGALSAAFALGVLAPPPDQPAYGTSWDAISYPLTLNLLVLVVVAFLAGYLAERLRHAGGQLEVATARAEKAERLALLGEFAAGLAHEIRNPLGSIGGSAALLADAPGLGADDRVLIDIIVRETTRLNELVTDVLDLSKPRVPILVDVDVAVLASEVVRLAAVSGRGLDVEVLYDGPARDVIVKADSAQLRQVLWNLVRNAVQASAAGTPVQVVVRKGHGRVFLEVRDRGAGIPESARAQLFDAFYSTRSQGIGIGLAVVKRIVEDHGFLIDVESAVGEGATFRVTIPAPPPGRSAEDALPPASAIPPPSRPPPASAVPSSPERSF